MVHKKIPKSLVERLRSFVDKRISQKRYKDIQRGFLRLQNADHRVDSNNPSFSNALREFDKAWPSFKDVIWDNIGFDQGLHLRVRKINVSRNYPRVKEVVVKRIDYGFRDNLEKLVENINKTKIKGVTFKPPIFEFLNDDIIVMARTNFPSINEMFGNNEGNFTTKRGKDFLKKFLEKNPTFSINDIKSKVRELEKYHYIRRNMLFAGVEKGQLVFIYLPDLL